MKRISLSRDGSNRLYQSLESNLSSLRKRSVSYTITAVTDDLAVVTLIVIGRKGKLYQEYIVKYDTMMGWEVCSPGIKWRLTGLSEIQSVLKSDVQRLSSTINKV